MQLMKMAQSKGRNNNNMIRLGQNLSVKNMKNKRHVLEDGWFVGKWATSGGEGFDGCASKESGKLKRGIELGCYIEQQVSS
jgi:hypothetical protein